MNSRARAKVEVAARVSRRSRTRREIEPLTFRCGGPARLREALIDGRWRVALEQQDGRALRRDGVEEQVQDALEQLGQRPVGEERPRRHGEDGEHGDVLARQLVGVHRRPGLEVGQLARVEDAGAPGGAGSSSAPSAPVQSLNVLAQRDHVAVAEGTLGRPPARR